MKSVCIAVETSRTPQFIESHMIARLSRFYPRRSRLGSRLRFRTAFVSRSFARIAPPVFPWYVPREMLTTTTSVTKTTPAAAPTVWIDLPPAAPARGEKSLDLAIARAQACLLGKQDPAGYWVGELQG